MTTTSAPVATRRTPPLALALSGLLLTDLAGGLIAVASGVNDWSSAWGGSALLAAPLPMIAGQVVLTWLALRLRSRWAALPAALLALACLVSVASGFFDGGLGNDALAPAHAAVQAFLLAVTGVVGVLAAARVRAVTRKPAARLTCPAPACCSGSRRRGRGRS